MHWILTEWSQVPPQPHVVTIGNFDGVHRGHQYLLEAVKARARDLHAHSLVITFDPLPPEVLAPDRAPRRLTLTEHRVRLIRQCGIERVLLVRFDLAFASLSAEDFIERLATATHPVEIVVGDDFHFGRNRSGNPTLLRHQAPRYGFQVSVVSRVGQESTTISSTAIRRAIAAGDVRTAWELLGRPHALIGSVIPGAGRGSQLGFPTANLAVFDRLILPADGIYATVARVRSTWYPAITYVGSRPTFPGAGHATEVYLLADAVPPLRDETLTVYLVDRLRPDQAFSSVHDLIEQMQEDERRARQRLASIMAVWPPPAVSALHEPSDEELPIDGTPERA